MQTLDERVADLRRQLDRAVRPNPPGLSSRRPHAGRVVAIAVAAIAFVALGVGLARSAPPRPAPPAIATANGRADAWFEQASESMEPALSAGARVLVTYEVDGLARGDLVVARVDHTDRNVIKRVIGLPGETIDIVDGVVTIDGTPLTEPYLAPGTVTIKGDPEALQRESHYFQPLPITLGSSEYFVLGDSRTNSLDSRATGPLDRFEITARVVGPLVGGTDLPPVDVGLASDECTVFMNPAVADDGLLSLADVIRGDGAVASITRVNTHDDALADFNELYPDMAGKAAAKDLPPSIRTKLRDRALAPEFEARARLLPDVVSVECRFSEPPPSSFSTVTISPATTAR